MVPESAGPDLRRAVRSTGWPRPGSKLPLHLTLRIAADDPPLREGRIEDGVRIERLETHLEAAEAAWESGVPLATLFLGPVLDDGAARPPGWPPGTGAPTRRCRRTAGAGCSPASGVGKIGGWMRHPP